MKILLLSDIHVNFEALSAIGEEYDALLCMGDLVDHGPNPKECIAVVRDLQPSCAGIMIVRLPTGAVKQCTDSP